MVKKKLIPLDHSVLLERVNYDPETGIFTWRKKAARAKIGERAGKVVKSGHRAIGICDIAYLEHRLAWLYVYGHMPDGMIDHINGIPSDNRIANLRLATSQQNQANRGPTRRNTTGFKGVLCIEGRWVARIRRGKLIHIGSFPTAEEAHKAYAAAAEAYYGEFARAK